MECYPRALPRSAKGQEMCNVPLSVPFERGLHLSMAIAFGEIAAYKGERHPNYLVNTCTGGRTDISRIPIKLSMERN